MTSRDVLVIYAVVAVWLLAWAIMLLVDLRKRNERHAKPRYPRGDMRVPPHPHIVRERTAQEPGMDTFAFTCRCGAEMSVRVPHDRPLMQPECPSCGTRISDKRLLPQRDVSKSPAPQRDTKRF